MKLKFALVALSALALCVAPLAVMPGCNNLSEDTKAKLSATGILAAEKTAAIAAKVLADGSGSDFLHSAATGLRSEMLNVQTQEDVLRVVELWTPKQAPYLALAAQLARVYADARKSGVPSPEAVEAVARGAQSAAMVKP